MLVLTPTRELALQVTAHAKALAAHTNLSIETIIGGVSHEEQLPALTKTTDIVVATLGRLLEYIEKEEFESHDIEVLVLDEADRMLDMGFIKDVNRIVEEARYRKHTMLFSATLEGAGLEKFANDILGAGGAARRAAAANVAPSPSGCTWPTMLLTSWPCWCIF